MRAHFEDNLLADVALASSTSYTQILKNTAYHEC